ncbi:MAG TPA: VOC family protein [Alphaproteobacteria bacterium]|nr:VOC family protein [Alphaproteobacteria bacterium]
MISLGTISYVRLGTRDVGAAVKFVTEIVGLQSAGEDGGAVYLRSDERDHTLVYMPGDPSDHTVGFEMADDAALDAAAGELERAGYAVKPGTPGECEQRRVGAFVTFKDPSGTKIDLVSRHWHSGRRYYGARDAGITGFSHVGLYTTDAKRDEKFWTETLNARVSDWIGPAPLLRIDPVHHRVALFPARRHGVQHINHQVASVDDVMRAYYFLRDRGVAIRFGPGRHATSGAVFLYFEGPDGMTYEYSTGVKLITDEASYKPRQFPFRDESFCLWGARPSIPEFQS